MGNHFGYSDPNVTTNELLMSNFDQVPDLNKYENYI